MHLLSRGASAPVLPMSRRPRPQADRPTWPRTPHPPAASAGFGRRHCHGWPGSRIFAIFSPSLTFASSLAFPPSLPFPLLPASNRRPRHFSPSLSFRGCRRFFGLADIRAVAHVHDVALVSALAAVVALVDVPRLRCRFRWR
jgi:hypothetical protein